jgi:hypothetical protein
MSASISRLSRLSNHNHDAAIPARVDAPLTYFQRFSSMQTMYVHSSRCIFHRSIEEAGRRSMRITVGVELDLIYFTLGPPDYLEIG